MLRCTIQLLPKGLDGQDKNAKIPTIKTNRRRVFLLTLCNKKKQRITIPGRSHTYMHEYRPTNVYTPQSWFLSPLKAIYICSSSENV